MTRFGYTLMTEQSGPRDLVRYAVAAEQVGFDFEVSSDHYSPWLTEQGHAPYAWTVLGAVAQATERVDLMTYVTCPTMRYHPAVSGEKSIEQFAPLGDHLIAVEPNADLVKGWQAARPDGGSASRTIGQITICWGRDKDAAVQKAHEQFRWFAGGWAVNADLPTPAGFSGATQLITPDQVAEQIPCGPDLDAIVDSVKPYWEAGFTDIALVQIGDEGQDELLAEAAQDVLEALRTAAP